MAKLWQVTRFSILASFTASRLSVGCLFRVGDVAAGDQQERHTAKSTGDRREGVYAPVQRAGKPSRSRDQDLADAVLSRIANVPAKSQLTDWVNRHSTFLAFGISNH